jgi:hypothetical protein
LNKEVIILNRASFFSLLSQDRWDFIQGDVVIGQNVANITDKMFAPGSIVANYASGYISTSTPSKHGHRNEAGEVPQNQSVHVSA